MKLNFKQAVTAPVFFSIKDEEGNEVYTARGKLGVNIGVNLTLYDANEVEVGRVESKKVSLKPTTFLIVNGVKKATIVKKYTAIKQRYVIEELGWEVEGNFLAHDYFVTDKTGKIATIKKEWFAWGDAFELDLKKEEHVLAAIALVLTIDEQVDDSGNGWRVNGHKIGGDFLSD